MNASSITVRVPLSIPKRGGRKVIVAPDGSVIPGARRQTATPADPALLKALARAFRWKQMLEEGKYASVSDIARAEKIDRTYVGDVLTLTLLAPDLVQAIMDGRKPPVATLPVLMEPFPAEWADQRAPLMGRVPRKVRTHLASNEDTASTTMDETERCEIICPALPVLPPYGMAVTAPGEIICPGFCPCYP
jgi:hypothetical protein